VRRGLVGLLASAAFCAAAPSAEAGWHAPVPTPPPPGTGSAPRLVAAGPGGRALVVLGGTDGSYVARVLRGGVLGAPTTISPPPGAPSIDAHAVAGIVGPGRRVFLAVTYWDGQHLGEVEHDNACCFPPGVASWTADAPAAALVALPSTSTTGGLTDGLAVAAGPGGRWAVAASSTGSELELDGAALLATSAGLRWTARVVRPLRNSALDAPVLRWTPRGTVAAWAADNGTVLVTDAGALRARAVPLPRPSSTDIGLPLVGMTADGTVVAQWVAGHRLWRASRPPGDRFGRAQLVARDVADSFSADQVLAVGRRSIVSVWTDSKHRMSASLSRPGARPGPPLFIARVDRLDSSADVVSDGRGGALVTYERPGGAIGAAHLTRRGRVTTTMLGGRSCSVGALLGGEDGTAVAQLRCGADDEQTGLVRYTP
jgi:hypothetical protein